ncbi:cuticle protein AMP1A-like [Procambarus clarkii]|uniref:cuticle protein AMP1A-like n=1 Tax=Procambarus clarkii TaxID=6728 RepID=UPI00374316CC
MKFVILAALAAVAAAAPQGGYAAPAAPSRYSESSEEIPILRDDRIHEEDGRYNFDIETGNGITLSQSGSPDGPEGAVVKSGSYSYTAPDGTPVRVTFVANENGYQPQSDLLPVAPEFPHPIPQFVLDQIAFAAAEDAAAARSGPSASYGAPQ